MSNVITKKDKDKVLNYMINQNDKTYNILKAAEELQELSLVLIQSLSKGVEEQEIIDEIGDVKFRIKVLEEYFNKEKIQERIDKKLKKNLEYLNNKKYKNI